MDNNEFRATKEDIVKSLVNFVNRVVGGCTTSDEEIKILPEIVHIILDTKY